MLQLTSSINFANLIIANITWLRNTCSSQHYFAHLIALSFVCSAPNDLAGYVTIIIHTTTDVGRPILGVLHTTSDIRLLMAGIYM